MWWEKYTIPNYNWPHPLGVSVTRTTVTAVKSHAQDDPLPEEAKDSWTSAGSALLTGAAVGAFLTALVALAAVLFLRRQASIKSGRRLLSSVGAPSPPTLARKPPYLFGTSSTRLSTVVEPYLGLEAMLEPIYSEPKNGEREKI